MKFSVIMPTMWRSHRTVSLIDDLCLSDHVDELIIIDNDPSARQKFQMRRKITLYNQEENIYVNPAWNLGVKEADNNLLCIINDDINLDFDYGLCLVEEFLSEKGTVIGIHPGSYKMDPNDTTIGVMPGHYIGAGWGCCIFMRKDDWVDIPEDLKTWYGDNWIVNNSKNAYSMLKAVSTEMSTTNNSISNIDEIQENDAKIWKELTST